MFIRLMLSVLFNLPGGDVNRDGRADLLDYAYVQTHDDWRDTVSGLQRLSAGKRGVIHWRAGDASGEVLLDTPGCVTLDVRVEGDLTIVGDAVRVTGKSP